VRLSSVTKRYVGTAFRAGVACAGAIALAWVGATTATGGSVDDAAIQRGAQLAAIGDCTGCHTMADGMPYAGGVPLATPFGTIHGTNITPDPVRGIGQWSEADFVRAMREGIDRDGRHLYPVFPYDHFTLITDGELHALYAYLMTRTPVATAVPANDVRFPFNNRALLVVWKALYLRKGAYRADPAQTPEWNRGAYLVHSLGHCGACHSPRNALGAEQRERDLSGGFVEGWYAPPLNERSPSPVPWTVEQLAAYLREGIADRHAIAGGPMQGVVERLAEAPPDDVRAMAVYLVSMMGAPTPERDARAAESLELARHGGSLPTAAKPSAAADDVQRGAAIYGGACSSCHDEGRRVGSGTALELPLSIAVHEDDPTSLIRIIRDGITAPEGLRNRWMPSFEGALTDEQIALLVVYLRTLAPQARPWSDVAEQVRKSRKS
jgi:mono/diheme cytochrome c family protein